MGGHRSPGAVICGVGNSSLRGGHLSFWKQRTPQWRRIPRFPCGFVCVFICWFHPPGTNVRVTSVWECVYNVCQASRLLARSGYCVLTVYRSQLYAHVCVRLYADTANLAQCLLVCTWGVHVVDKVRKICVGLPIFVCMSST